MKDDRIYLRHILRCVSRIEEYVADGRDAFMASHLIQDGVIRNLQTLAESSQCVSEPRKASQPGVDWKGLAGFRKTCWSTITWVSTSNLCIERWSATFPS